MLSKPEISLSPLVKIFCNSSSGRRQHSGSLCFPSGTPAAAAAGDNRYMASLSFSTQFKPSLTSSRSKPSRTTTSNPTLVSPNPRSTASFSAVASSAQPMTVSYNPFTAAGPQTPATAMRGAETDAMGLLLRERIVFLGSPVDDFVADGIISQLLLLDAQDPTRDIRLFINSPGGSLSATMAIYDVIQLIRADVSTVGLGIAASASSILLAGGTKGKRFAMPNTRIMLHQPIGGASGQAIDVEIQAKEIMHQKQNVIRIVSEITGRTRKQVEKDIDRDRYMSPMEAVEYGILDGCIDKDTIIPLQPVPARVKSRLNYEEISKDPKKWLTPDIPDEEIY